MKLFANLLADESGQGMTEYAILVGTLALGAILTLVAIGSRIKDVFTNVQTQLNNVPTS
jgi:Flp pilus assembly pilin Flp